MSKAAELLALQKEVLLARSRLQRLRIAHELGVVHEHVRLPRVAQLAQSSRAQAAAITGLFFLFGRGRLGRMLRVAAVLTAAARLVHEWRVRRAPDEAITPAPAPPPVAPEAAPMVH